MLTTASHAGRIAACCICFAAPLATPVAAQDGPQAPAPASEDAPLSAAQPPDAQSLVARLGDADFKVREAASERLKAMGPAALPALKDAIASSQDPEVCSRADSLVRQIERPRVPRDWLGPDGFGGRGFGAMHVSTFTVRGTRLIKVRDGGGVRKVTISEGPGGIELTVAGLDAGKEVTATFRARTPAELAEQDADAYRIYQRWANNGGAQVFRGPRLGRPAPLIRPQFLPAPPPDPVLRPPADDLVALEAALLRQLQEAKVPADQRQTVQNLVDAMQNLQAEGRALDPAEWDEQIRKYNALSDALRQKLADLKLPDPGGALPPPAKSRLGVSVSEARVDGMDLGGGENAVVVRRVIAGSRGDKLGLKEGDVILKVNGKAVPDTAALRRSVSEGNAPLVIDVTRGGAAATLREKPRP